MNSEQIAKNLIELRGKKSRREVCEVVDICVSALGMYERGERVPSDDVKVRLAKYYDTTVSDIFFAE